MGRTDDISFYHGTSATAAASMIEHGARNIFVELKLNDVAQQIWDVIVEEAGGRHLTTELFEKAGCVDPIGASLLLEGAALGRQEGRMSYGAFYVSMRFLTACDYARRSPAGSECMAVISEGLKVLAYLNSASKDGIANNFPEALKALSARSYPVVVELNGINEARIMREDGNPDCWPHIELGQRRELDGSFHAPFRIQDVKSADIIWVYDLRMWPSANFADPSWWPTLAEMERLRVSAKTWKLAGHNNL
jgi:hypothetical protein